MSCSPRLLTLACVDGNPGSYALRISSFSGTSGFSCYRRVPLRLSGAAPPFGTPPCGGACERQPLSTTGRVKDVGVRTIDEAQVLVAIREFETDGVSVTVASLATYLHWAEERLQRALAALLREQSVYMIGPFLHLTRTN